MDAVGTTGEHSPAGLGQGGGAGGTAHLIGHNPQGFTGLGLDPMQLQHREQEVPAHRAVHPAGAQDAEPLRRQPLGRGLLTGGLGAAVHTEGITGLIGPVGGALGPVEDEIRAHLEQGATGLGQGSGEGPGGAGIHPLGQLRLRFSAVDRGVGPGADHPVGPVGMHGGLAGGRVGQIELLTSKGQQLHRRRTLALQLLTELTGSAGDQNTHGWSFRSGASASLAERRGDAAASAPSRAGQAIARSGSSQRTACSQSRFQKSVVL